MVAYDMHALRDFVPNSSRQKKGPLHGGAPTAASSLVSYYTWQEFGR